MTNAHHCPVCLQTLLRDLAKATATSNAPTDEDFKVLLRREVAGFAPTRTWMALRQHYELAEKAGLYAPSALAYGVPAAP